MSSTAPWSPSVGADSYPDARVLLTRAWTFTPGPASIPDASALLCYGGERIELRESSEAFEKFLSEMREIQDEFDRLWSRGPADARHREWAGRTRHV
ncbi:hypothetical protein [Streptomyces sp. NPDC000410]|uniref:hypothetical protein n=1 Tax=Streptomyces sp. NPDC000410 TaxID=3154254 RepID=UPI00331F4B50